MDRWSKIFDNEAKNEGFGDSINVIRTHNHSVRKWSLNHSTKLGPVWLNGWVFAYEVSGCRFEYRCFHLNFIYRACFYQGVTWHLGNYRV